MIENYIPYESMFDVVVRNLRSALDYTPINDANLVAYVMDENGVVVIPPSQLQFTGQPGHYRASLSSVGLILNQWYVIVVRSQPPTPPVEWRQAAAVQNRPFGEE